MGGEILKISISETTEPIGTKLCLNTRTIPPKFGLNCSGGFKGEDFSVIVEGRTTDAK
jgi:hypothetical protein